MAHTDLFCAACGDRLDAAGQCTACQLALGLGGGDERRTEVLPEDRFPGYEMLERIGQGGMGVVYKARHRRLGRLVAIKELAPELVRRPDFARRFEREAKAMAALSHPGLVQIHDFGVEAEHGFLVMEFVEGATLRQLMQEGRLTPAQSLDVVAQVCEALQYAHGKGIVHRDIKPENILVDEDGRAKVADFGLARLVGDEGQRTRLTLTDHVVGTPQYMAPEQVETPLAVDHRADIYALGVVFYELLTGTLPLGRFDPPSLGSGVDPRIDDVVMKALEREPARRYQSAGDLRAELAGEARNLARGPAAARPRSTGDVAAAFAWFEPAASAFGLLSVALLLVWRQEVVGPATSDTVDLLGVLTGAAIALPLLLIAARWLLPATRWLRPLRDPRALDVASTCGGAAALILLIVLCIVHRAFFAETPLTRVACIAAAVLLLRGTAGFLYRLNRALRGLSIAREPWAALEVFTGMTAAVGFFGMFAQWNGFALGTRPLPGYRTDSGVMLGVLLAIATVAVGVLCGIGAVRVAGLAGAALGVVCIWIAAEYLLLVPWAGGAGISLALGSALLLVLLSCALLVLPKWRSSSR